MKGLSKQMDMVCVLIAKHAQPTSSKLEVEISWCYSVLDHDPLMTCEIVYHGERYTYASGDSFKTALQRFERALIKNKITNNSLANEQTDTFDKP